MQQSSSLDRLRSRSYEMSADHKRNKHVCSHELQKMRAGHKKDPHPCTLSQAQQLTYILSACFKSSSIAINWIDLQTKGDMEAQRWHTEPASMSESDPLALNWASLINTARERERGKGYRGQGIKGSILICISIQTYTKISMYNLVQWWLCWACKGKLQNFMCCQRKIPFCGYWGPCTCRV